MSSKSKNKAPENKEKIIKTILLGNSNTGKTSLINRFVSDSFSNSTIPTIGSTCNSRSMIIKGKKVRLDLWDTAGQEQYRSLGKLYVKNSKIVILVYDITSEKSFEGIKFWYDFIKNELGEEITLGLAGNKIDLFENEKIPKEKAEECAKEWGAEFALLSAKEDKKGTEEFLTKLAEKYLERIKDSEDNLNPEAIKIKKERNTIGEKNDSGCCGGGKSQKVKEIKIAFLGNNGVGKTNIISAIRGKEINKKYEHTKKIQNITISYVLEDKKKVYVNLIDTNGNDFSDSEMKNILKECKNFFLVFDFRNRDSFQEIDNLVKKIRSNGNENKYINILGNKTNLEDEKQQSVSNEEAETFAKDHTCHYQSISLEKIDCIQDLIKKNIDNYLLVK